MGEKRSSCPWSDEMHDVMKGIRENMGRFAMDASADWEMDAIISEAVHSAVSTSKMVSVKEIGLAMRVGKAVAEKLVARICAIEGERDLLASDRLRLRRWLEKKMRSLVQQKLFAAAAEIRILLMEESEKTDDKIERDGETCQG